MGHPPTILPWRLPRLQECFRTITPKLPNSLLPSQNHLHKAMCPLPVSIVSMHPYQPDSNGSFLQYPRKLQHILRPIPLENYERNPFTACWKRFRGVFQRSVETTLDSSAIFYHKKKTPRDGQPSDHTWRWRTFMTVPLHDGSRWRTFKQSQDKHAVFL